MKPLLVGLHNPHSVDPRHALLPWPVHATGHRILELIQGVDPAFTERQYLDAFDRRNLWRGPELPEGRGTAAMYRAEGRLVLMACENRRYVVLLGARVWDSVLPDHRPPEWFESRVVDGTRYWYMPHPSRRNIIYNMADNQLRAGQILHALALGVSDVERWMGEARA